MLDIAVAYNKYKYLGNEFLTWLWYAIESDLPLSPLAGIPDQTVALAVGNTIVLENSQGDKATEKITIKGDDAGLEEGTTALKKGAQVTQMNLILTIGDEEFRFTLKGESMNVTSLKTPATGAAGSDDELEGAVLEKIYLISKVDTVIDTLFKSFIKKRLSDEWKNQDLAAIRTWINR